MAYGDLTTLDAVKQWLITAPAPDYDWDMLSGLITSASDFIHKYLNRFIPIADYEEIRDGTGGTTLIFANFPVISVSLVAVDGIDIPASPNRIARGYLFTPTEITLRADRFWRDKQNVVLSYTAGYAHIPPAISQACVEFVATRYRERARIAIVQETIVGVQSTTYSKTDLLPSTLLQLQQYISVAPISGYSRRLAPTATDITTIAAAL